MSFSITSNLNQQNNFLIKWSGISGKRWNPSFYNGTEKVINTIKLGKLVSIKGGKRIPKGMSFSNEETKFKYLRVENLNDFSIDYENTKYLSEETFNLLKRYELNHEDLIISIAGTIGKIGLFESDGKNKYILTENCAKIIINSKTILGKYLAIILRSEYMQEQINQNYIKTTIPKLGLDRVLNLEIPVPPPVKVQEKIIALMDNAYKNKIDCDQKAKELLDGIDGYLLKELGIELPDKIVNSLTNRKFYRKWSEISGHRWEPQYHLKEVRQYFANYPIDIGKMITLDSVAIVTDGTHHTPEYVDSGIKFLSVKNIKEYSIDFEDVKYISLKEHQRLIKRANPKPLDILFTKVGTIGKAKVIPLDACEFSIFVSLSLIKLIDKSINPYFLEAVLNSSIIKLQIDQEVKGIGVPDLHLENINKLIIPIVDRDKQHLIVGHLRRLINEANSIKEKGLVNLIEYKRQIEKMIVGEIYE